MPRERPLTWFVDRSLGKKLVRALRAMGEKVEWHGDHFPESAEDEVWIPYAASRGWPILTKDKAIRRVSAERKAVVSSAAVFVCLGSGSMTADDQIACVIQSWEPLVTLVVAREPPLIVTVTRVGLREYDSSTARWVPVSRPRARKP